MDSLKQLTSALADRYHVEREIGRGGMATVFLARDLRHERQVALKVLNPELGAVLGVERFLSEIRVTANLQHPNLLPLFDSGEVATGTYSAPGSSLLFYVMPFVEGESLRARLDREKQLPVHEAVRIAAAVAGALDYAHRNGVIHRDLKPENILLHEGQPLIADFGIALAVSNAGGSRVTQTGLSLGTPQYMSPEQATGDRAIDRRSDIYSLAAVAYEMLGGEPPHAGATAQAIIARLLTESPRSLRIERPAVPEHVDAALARALEKLPADRFPTAGEFAAALTAGEATSARRTAPRQGGSRGTVRTRLRDPLTLLLLASTVGASVLAASAYLGRPADAAGAAVIRFGMLQGRLSADGYVGSPFAISPDGRRIVYIGVAGDDVSRLYVRSLDQMDPIPLPGTERAFMPVFSGDGNSVAFWAAGRLQKIALRGGSPVMIAEHPLVYGITWARGVMVTSLGNALTLIPEAGGAARALEERREPGTADQWPVMIDDDLLAFARSGAGTVGGSELGIASITGRKTWMLGVPGSSPVGYMDGHLIYVSPPNGLFAVRLDLRGKVAVGDPIPLPGDVRVGSGGAARAAISTSGTLIYYEGSRAGRLLALDGAGGSREVIPGNGVWEYPRLSPDGRVVALTVGGGGRTDIWLYDLVAGTQTRLTTDGRVNERAEWSPDGKRVLYRSDRGMRSAIWWQPVDRSGPAEPLLASDSEDYYEAVLTPDGSAIVYQLDTLQSDVYYRKLDGSSPPQPIAASRFGEDMARVSPDGRWVAFQTEESGVRQVVVQPLPGPGGRVQVSADGGAEPVWARDGRTLFYRLGRRIFAASVATGPEFRVTSRRMVVDGDYFAPSSPHANYDVAPDGSLIVIEGSGDASLTVVHNWRRELQAVIRSGR
jgi:eukaryotic-like serine/threonine-protein kinase